MGKNRAASEYVLIDLENVQPKNLELLKKHSFKVLVFCGANQVRILLAVASRLQELGTNARYVEMSGNRAKGARGPCMDIYKERVSNQRKRLE